VGSELKYQKFEKHFDIFKNLNSFFDIRDYLKNLNILNKKESMMNIEYKKIMEEK